MTLVDTNVVLRAIQPSHPLHDIAVHAISTLLRSGERVFFAVQNVAEFWNVATRPATSNGLGLRHDRAWEELAKLEEWFEILAENADSYTHWKGLLGRYQVSGSKVHDARLASVMLANGVSSILSFNADDFTRFEDIKVIRPEELTRLV